MKRSNKCYQMLPRSPNTSMGERGDGVPGRRLICVVTRGLWGSVVLFVSTLLIVFFFRYLQAVPVLLQEQRADFSQVELVMTKEFISQQLIHLIDCLDTNEEGGR